MPIENWVEKYRPQKLSDLVENSSAIKELIEWGQSWLEDIPENRAIILHGFVGTGKTTSAHALAKDMGWEITELNASDQRTKVEVEKVAGTGSRMGTIEGSKRLIILDEADNLYVREDKGGERAVIELIKRTRQPIILTANELYEISSELRASCKLIKFEPISLSSIIRILKTIADLEHKTYEGGVIEEIANNADGDLRGAINDLQAIGQDIFHIKLEDITVDKRDDIKDIFSVLKNIFRAKDAKESYEAIFSTDKDPENMIQWIDENVSIEYTRPVDLNDAYYYVSKAATFLGRVRRRKNYSMWKYASFLMTAGVFTSTRKRKKESLKYYKPQIIDKLWRTKNTRVTRDSLAKKIGLRCHTSIGFARSQLFPFFRFTMMNKSYAEYISASLDLTPEEIAFIMNLRDTKDIYDIYNKAQSIKREDEEYLIESFDEINKKGEQQECQKISASKYGKAQTTIDEAWG